MANLRKSKTHRINNWEAWKELCEHYDFDPYETVEFGIDEGGGNSTDFEYIGDTPEREERMGELRSKCHGAEVEIMESDMPDSGFRMQKHLGYKCDKCNEPCEVEEKEEE